MTDLSEPQMGEIVIRKSPLDDWQGKFGDEYTERNTALPITPRIDLWAKIWQAIGPAKPVSILEVGANIGLNLLALKHVNKWSAMAYMAAVEPNAKAREALMRHDIPAYPGQAEQIDFPADSFDLVFTSGVLVHICPTGQNHLESPLRTACKEIVRVSKQWVVAIEYFSAQPREIIYRDRRGLLWARDFGQYYMDEFGLVPVACGFAWKALTGLDNLTWWLLHKP